MDVTVHAVTSRPGRLARARLGANVQRSVNAGFQYDAPAGAGQRPALRLLRFPRACGSLWGGRNTRCRPYRQRNMAMRRWYGKRIHVDVMIGRASRRSKASGSAAVARSGTAVRREVPERTSATLALATRYDAIPGLREFVGDPPRDRALGR